MKIQLLTETTDAGPFLADGDWCAQEKIDCVRCLLISDANGVRAVSRQSKPLKLTAAILRAASGVSGDFIIDGELVGGRFVAFDVQRLAGRDVAPLPMIERFAMLARLPFERVRCAIGEDDKRQLLETVRAESGEGVVFKFLHEPYVDGRTPAAVKFKFLQREVFVVADVDIGTGTVALLASGRDCRRCSFPLNAPWPSVGDLVEVRFAKWTRHGKLCHPVWCGLRRGLVEVR